MKQHPIVCFTASLDNLVDKIRERYPSLDDAESYMIAGGIVDLASASIDDPDIEKQISELILKLKQDRTYDHTTTS